MTNNNESEEKQDKVIPPVKIDTTPTPVPDQERVKPEKLTDNYDPKNDKSKIIKG